jgi:hypothetical protein
MRQDVRKVRRGMYKLNFPTALKFLSIESHENRFVAKTTPKLCLPLVSLIYLLWIMYSNPE